MITRYYSYELNGLKFEVEPPKLKTLRKLTEIIKEQKTELTQRVFHEVLSMDDAAETVAAK